MLKITAFIIGISFGWLESLNGVGNLVAPYYLRLGNIWPNLPGVLLLSLIVPTLIFGYFVIPETKFAKLWDRIYGAEDSDYQSDNDHTKESEMDASVSEAAEYHL
ncbi:MAG: hypothetical protein GY696_31250 [Gammaproteobacteria bacterium]|nr:hypothetical protein [Gammaproteobacteria bacterium]